MLTVTQERTEEQIQNTASLHPVLQSRSRTLSKPATCSSEQIQTTEQACTLFCRHITKVGKGSKHAAAAATCKLKEIS